MGSLRLVLAERLGVMRVSRPIGAIGKTPLTSGVKLPRVSLLGVPLGRENLSANLARIADARHLMRTMMIIRDLLIFGGFVHFATVTPMQMKGMREG